MSTGALERALRRSREDALERCDLCSLPVPDQHRHVLDLERGDVLCACRACTLLFDREAAGKTSTGRDHFRLIPERRLRLDGISPAELGVPVGLAYFVRRQDGTVLAHYPSPMGATQWEVDDARWAGAEARAPVLRELEPEVEAVLLNTAKDRAHRWLVPIDDCFRLNAIVRQEWTGFFGGSRVWTRIAEFFDQLKESR